MTWTVAHVSRSIPEAFEEQVRRWADEPAVAGLSWHPTFAELDAAANRHAHMLIERRGPGAERIALLLADDAPLVAATLGVLKAGKTAVVLNPSDPPARLEQILLDVRPELVLTDAHHVELAVRAGADPSGVATLDGRADDSHRNPPTVDLDADRAAFVIYTSGSTGRPKGVIQTHRSLLDKVVRLTSEFGVVHGDRLPLLASMSGSSGITLLWTVLLNGATLCVFSLAERGMTGLADWLVDQQITVLLTSASVFRHFVATLKGNVTRGMRLVVLGGEPVLATDVEACRRHFGAACKFVNLLASTEAGSIATYWVAAEAELDDGPLLVGHPVRGVEVSLLDDAGAPARPGETGEIVVSSPYLSPGYWADEALTAQRFVQGPSGRMFRTGDLGRLSPEGVLAVVGRRDLQVKVRGTRIGLAEIEGAIARLPKITGAVVCPSSTPRGSVRLTAYMTTQPGAIVSSACLRQTLRGTLPERELPNAFVFLDAFPLNRRGKVDRELLAQTPPPRKERREPSSGETERLLGDIWAGALEVDDVGRNDDFFDLGGDSLTAAVIGAGLHASFGVELDLGAIAENPSVARMARLVDRLRAQGLADDRPRLSSVSRDAPLPLSFAQERVWRSSLMPEGRLGHNLAIALHIAGPLDLAALRQSVDHIARRHEALRTTFLELDGEPVQVVHPPSPVDLEVLDFGCDTDPPARANELLVQEARTPFDLQRGPLLRLRLVRLADDEHVLLRIVHHIVSDAWSWRVFLTELRVLYEACHLGRPLPLPDDPPLQYADFAAWERRHLDPGTRRHQEQVNWWARTLGNQSRLPLELPCARAIPPQLPVEPSAGMLWWGLEPEVSSGLDRLALEVHATHYMMRLALFAAQLVIDTGRQDLILGAYMTNRRLIELQAMLGDFTNLTTLSLPLDGNPTFRQWIAHVRAVVIETSAHSEVPYEHVREALNREGVAMPEIRAIFGIVYEPPPMRFGGLEVASLPSSLQVAPTGFTFLINPHNEADRCQIYFDIKSYDPEGVRAFVGRYKRIAAQVATNLDRPLREFATL